MLLLYRPGSAAISAAFFEELSSILDQLATPDAPLIVAGDVNIHLERPDEPYSRRFTDLLATYGLQSRVAAPTHDHGGWLDIVATRVDLPALRIDVVDPGFSDHRLLQWTSQLQRPAPVYRQVTCRPWRTVAAADFTDMLQHSTLLLDSDAVSPDTMTDNYNAAITSIADSLAPARAVTFDHGVPTRGLTANVASPGGRADSYRAVGLPCPARQE